MKKMNALDWVAWVLVVIGGLNWGLVGFFDFNLVSAIFGETSSLTKVVYALVGLSALYLLVTASKMVSSGNSSSGSTERNVDNQPTTHSNEESQM